MKGILTRSRFICLLSIYFAFAVGAVVIAPLFGDVEISLQNVCREIFGGEIGSDSEIFVGLRLPRVILGLLAGGALAIVGASFQVVLRNPLATPFTLGITGGGSLGAVLAISFPVLAWSFGPFSTIQLFALLGSFVALGFIYVVARRTAGLSMNIVLLAGVTFGIFTGAIILLIQYHAKPDELVNMHRWMMGGLDIGGFDGLLGLLPLLVPALVVIVMQAPQLNHLALGEEMAAGHGIDVARVQRRTLIAGGVATAAVVSLTGPIGFVGLIIPHIVRKLSGNDQRIVLPASFALGGTLLVVCDVIARTIIPPTEIPVGVITAMVGGPIFIILLVTRQAQTRGT